MFDIKSNNTTHTYIMSLFNINYFYIKTRPII